MRHLLFRVHHLRHFRLFRYVVEAPDNSRNHYYLLLYHRLWITVVWVTTRHVIRTVCNVGYWDPQNQTEVRTSSDVVWKRHFQPVKHAFFLKVEDNTDSLKQSPCWEAESSQLVKKFPICYGIRRLRYPAYENSPFVPLRMSQNNLFYAFPSCFFNISV
jgi:hypothetical protein